MGEEKEGEGLPVIVTQPCNCTHLCGLQVVLHMTAKMESTQKQINVCLKAVVHSSSNSRA